MPLFIKTGSEYILIGSNSLITERKCVNAPFTLPDEPSTTQLIYLVKNFETAEGKATCIRIFTVLSPKGNLTLSLKAGLNLFDPETSQGFLI